MPFGGAESEAHVAVAAQAGVIAEPLRTLCAQRLCNGAEPLDDVAPFAKHRTLRAAVQRIKLLLALTVPKRVAIGSDLEENHRGAQPSLRPTHH